jgi:hypothetical protein
MLAASWYDHNMLLSRHTWLQLLIAPCVPCCIPLYATKSTYCAALPDRRSCRGVVVNQIWVVNAGGESSWQDSGLIKCHRCGGIRDNMRRWWPPCRVSDVVLAAGPCPSRKEPRSKTLKPAAVGWAAMENRLVLLIDFDLACLRCESFFYILYINLNGSFVVA